MDIRLKYLYWHRYTVLFVFLLILYQYIDLLRYVLNVQCIAYSLLVTKENSLQWFVSQTSVCVFTLLIPSK